MAWPAGLHLPRSDYIRMCWRLRSPTSLRESPGRYSIGAAHTNHVLLHRPPNLISQITSMRFLPRFARRKLRMDKVAPRN
jgi:hypothetical protein